MVGLGDANPIHLVLYPQALEQGADVPRFLRRAEVVELVQAGLKFKPASFETGGKPAGQIVLFQQQTGSTALENPDGRGKTAVSGAL